MEKSQSSDRIRILIGTLISFACAAAWSIFRSGTDTVYYLHSDAIRAANWPNPGLRVEEAYTRTSAIGPWVYKLIGGDSDVKYLAMNIVAAMLGVFLLALWCFMNVPTQNKPRAVRLVLLAPIVAVLATQIGNYDPFTVVGFALVLFAWSSRERTLLIGAGFYLGLQHFEQGLLGILLLGTFVFFARAWLPTKVQSLPSLFWVLIGLLAGKVALSVILAINGVSVSDGRASWVSDPELLRISIIGSINFLPALLMSLFAGAWAIVLASALTGMKRSAQVAGLVLLSFAGVLAVVTLDHTRTFVLITLPLLSVLTVGLLNKQPGELSPKSLRLVEAMAWLIVPVSLFTSPDGPTFLKDMNVTDHFLMVTHYMMNLA